MREEGFAVLRGRDMRRFYDGTGTIPPSEYMTPKAENSVVFHEIQSAMFEIRQTSIYKNWFSTLRDKTARARIDVRIRRLSLGNHGDAKPVGEGISELRVDYGPGYRIYFIQRGESLVVLLAGGDKSSQRKDIQAAKALAKTL